ncbi:class I SAM-dependent methyltransferase [Anaeromicrobium sediminis]|uniref:Methyltransferase type 11 domain-containing protein n=1 Tax=Anaeromicrobium sediminis TaxID=1478221 RepID=A0A267MPB3_9FIRM|nr:class I SAM-dependent methyltransferase [Anaeromicrobium sediminis]PAB60570.1 hypothetical protein CCE28_03225 [Anaeromicrobium sediminis]
MGQEKLIKIFGERPTRMDLLKDSISRIELTKESRILEAGCSFGDGIAYACEYTGASGYGIDLLEDYIVKAREKHKNIDFQVGSVYGLSYDNDFFDLVFSQAAFSLLKEKDKAIKEYYRTLKPGGHVIINDFVIKEKVEGMVMEEMDFIPCFNSIGTIEEYVNYFKEEGFKVVLAEDRYSEIVRTTLHLSKEYKCTPMEMAALFAQILGNSEDSVQRSQCFFNRAKVSYGQLIFKKV